jgi:hypothetical protein
MCGSLRLEGYQIRKIVWRGGMEKTIGSREKFVFDTFLYFKPVKGFKNLIRVGI